MLGLEFILDEQYNATFADKVTRNKTIKEVYALLKRTIDFSDFADNPKYSGLKETILPAMEKAFEPENMGSVSSIKLLSGDLENFIKKIIVITEGSLDRVLRAQDGNLYLKELIRHLNIAPRYACYLDNIKDYRNENIHNSVKIPLHEYYPALRDIVLSYLLIVNHKYSALYEKVFSEHIFNDYLQTVVDDYNIQQAIFVELEVKEYIEIIGKEVQARGENQREARKDTISNLKKQIPEKQMMILGQAGMGKTTSLRYLAMKDAEIYATKKNVSLPVYLTLAAFDSQQDTIVGKIADRIERKTEFVEDYLKKGKITLFLDGFNEVLDRLKTEVIRMVQNFIDKYPETQMLIASRPVAYEDIDFRQAGTQALNFRKPIPAFLLLEMKENLIQDFITKNYKNGDSVALWAFLQQPQNKMLLDTLKNPLYLAEFLTIYKDGEKTPPSTAAITARFIAKKYQREKDQIDATFQKHEFNRLMAFYTQHISIEEAFGMQNPQVPHKKAVEIIKEVIEEERMETSPDKFLRSAVSMNLFLKHRNQSYSFAHQSYQDYFADYEDED